MEQEPIEMPNEEENQVINKESDQERNSTDSSKLANPFVTTSDDEAPPIPERPNEDTIPKAYTLGYDDLLANDDLEYGDQSYIENDLLRYPPPVPAPLPPTVRKDLLNEDQNLSLSTSVSPTTPSEENNSIIMSLPSEMVSDESSFKDQSIDEIIGLAPEKQEEKKGMKELLGKMKDQTSNMFNRIFRRGSQEVELPGLDDEEEEEEEEYSDEEKEKEEAKVDVFASIPGPEAPSAPDNNDDVGSLFGLSEEVEEPTNLTRQSEHKLFFHSDKDPYDDIVKVLHIGKLVTASELECIQKKYEEDKKNVLRILQNFLVKGEDIEFNRMVGRSSPALPENELKLKVIKDKNGGRYDVKRLQAITLSVPKIFVYDDCFFFLLEMRTSKINLKNQWNSCVVRLSKYQLRVYQTLGDISPEKTILRCNFHQLMMATNVQSKVYKQTMYYYFKLFENDLWNHRVLESKPLKYRHDLSSILLVKLGSKEEIVLRTLVYQLHLRLKSINSQERLEF